MSDDQSNEITAPVADAPPAEIGSTLNLPQVIGQINRLIQNRARQLDRFNSLHLFGPAREDELKRGLARGRICPGDPPAIQMVMKLVEELENTKWDDIDDAYKRHQIKNALFREITTLIDSEGQKHNKTFAELMELVEQRQRKIEHEDRMRVAEKTGDQALSDEELMARAAELRAKRNKAIEER